MSSDPSAAKPIKKWTPKKPAPGEALPSLFAAAANTSLSVKPKPKPTTAPKPSPATTEAANTSNLPSLFAASASLSSTNTTTTNNSSSSNPPTAHVHKPVVIRKPILSSPSPTESSGLPTLFQAAATTKPLVKKRDSTAQAAAPQSSQLSTDNLSPQPSLELSNHYNLPTATPAPTPVTTKSIQNSSFTVSSIHIPDTTTTSTTSNPSGGPHDSTTSDLSNLPPTSSSNNNYQQVDDDDDDEAYEQASASVEPEQAKKVDDDSVSISSVEVTSSEEEDDDD